MSIYITYNLEFYDDKITLGAFGLEALEGFICLNGFSFSILAVLAVQADATALLCPLNKTTSNTIIFFTRYSVKRRAWASYIKYK